VFSSLDVRGVGIGIVPVGNTDVCHELSPEWNAAFGAMVLAAWNETQTARLVKSHLSILTSRTTLPGKGNDRSMMKRCSNRVTNLAHYLTRNAMRWPQRQSVVWEGRTWTWGELDRRVSALCNALTTEFGIKKGDCILVQAQNSNQMIEIMLAAFRLGAVWVPCNFRQAPAETAYAGQKAKAKLFICDAEFEDQADAVRNGQPDLVGTICIGASHCGENYEELIDRFDGLPFENAAVDYDDPCWLFFTSGSTGRPKAVVLTHGQIGFVTVNYLADLLPGTSELDASLVIAPLSHGAGLQLIAQLPVGAAHVLMPGGGFSPAAAFELIEKHRVSNLFTVPTIVKRLVEDPAVDRFDHSSLLPCIGKTRSTRLKSSAPFWFSITALEK